MDLIQRPLPSVAGSSHEYALADAVEGSLLVRSQHGRPSRLQRDERQEAEALVSRVRFYLRIRGREREAAVAQECHSELARRARSAGRP
jgi:hypothetical protein